MLIRIKWIKKLYILINIKVYREFLITGENSYLAMKIDQNQDTKLYTWYDFNYETKKIFTQEIKDQKKVYLNSNSNYLQIVE